MIVTQKYGGAVLGAFSRRALVGFVYALLARRAGEIIHWSHMMAVRRGFRDQGIGFRMKLAHRRLALEDRIKSICWTYDPLQGRNATLNIFRLGARVEEFIPNLYGHFPSRIEKGLPSDRFVVAWPIASRAVERCLAGGPPSSSDLRFPRVNETRLNSRGLLENRRISFGLRERRLLVEIPTNTDEIRARSIDLAQRWRMQARRIFARYFSAGYRVTQFVPPTSATGGRCYYVLGRIRRTGGS
jgi:predicted GNAT superfamily acetyltransferase